jgi:nitrate/TMAO reductase-like tetraheme cytochrome c subunit
VKRMLNWLRRFFLSPAGAPLWLRLLPYGVLGVLTLVFLAGGAYAWEYTNSSEFCGTACHTMPPEYTAYLISPHARVACVECHIGRDFITTRITRKAGDIKHIFATAFETYEYPIRAKGLRPARETCERCHSPEKFSDDSLREIKLFEPDRYNTPTSIYLVLKTGGGSQRVGLGRGIHWHIENPVLYLPLDPTEQVIPYVKVVYRDGSVTEFVDVESTIDPRAVNPDDLKEMDCITCHNRITHMIFTPEDTVNQLMDRGLIAPDIPEIRRLAVEVYSLLYDSVEMGLNGIAGIAAYYKVYHPDFFENRSEDIESAIAALQEAYSQSVFPEQNVNWDSHPNNVGHTDSPGCFRCHGGKHLSDQQEAIRLECNLCHSIPVVAGREDFVASIEISRGPEPSTHLITSWIGLHNAAFDSTCENCHTVEDPGGVSNTSFCSNSACHGSVLEYAGLDAPALRKKLIEQLLLMPVLLIEIEIEEETPPEGELTYAGVIGRLFENRCGACHQGQTGQHGLDVTTYDGLLEGGSSGPAITPHEPVNSLVLDKLTSGQRHFSQFTEEEMELIIDWIEQGAPDR